MMQPVEMPEVERMGISEDIAKLPREKVKRLQEMGFISKGLKADQVYFELSDKERKWLLDHIIVLKRTENWINHEWKKWHRNHVIKRRKIVKGRDGERIEWETIPEEEHYQLGEDEDSRINKLRRRLKPGEAWFKIKNGDITDRKASTSPPPLDIQDKVPEVYEMVLDTIDHSLQVVQDKFFNKATSPGGTDRERLAQMMTGKKIQRFNDNGEKIEDKKEYKGFE